MDTMVDEMFDRQYRAGRNEMIAAIADGLSKLANAVRNAFEVLVRIEYQAPWAAKSTRARCS
jgi:hypothetical protein